MNSFTIKDLENLSGIKAHTIRIWEQRYSFLKPRRTNTNIRLYSNENLKKILNISLLNKYGYKISHINTMSEAEMKEKIFSLNATEAQQDYIVNELIQCMVDLDTIKLEKILQSHIETRSIQKTIIQIIFPFLEKIGILWLTNHINPAQEHLVCNIIRQKLIVAIENTPTQIKKEKTKTVLLFLPEGEYHELGLLFICYLLKNKGVQTIYLGCNISLADVQYIVKLKKPHFLYCHLTATGKKFNFEKFVTTIAKSFATPIIISGRLTSAYHKKKPSSISFKTSFPQVMEFIDTI